MLKAIFLDMDETLCDTQSANRQATKLMAEQLSALFGVALKAKELASAYVSSMYRNWDASQRARYMPIIEQRGEGAFRAQLLHDLLAAQSIDDVNEQTVHMLLAKFDSDRLDAFEFYPGIMEFLTDARKLFTLVVITNGPEFSQVPKVEAVNLAEHVDHIIIGGQEPEQKPARSIFEKALRLANCEAHEAIHIGDSLRADIAGANATGISAVWIQHQQPLDAELGINPEHTVLHPSEIPALIRQIQGD